MAIDTGYQGAGNGGPMHHAKRSFEEARAFGSSLSSSASKFNESLDLRGRVQRNPFGMVLAAAGIGYVLGGGLFSPLTSKMLKVGIRLALIPLVKSQLSEVASEAFGSSGIGGQAGGPTGGSSAV